jgi:hypothetical protein
MLSFLVLWRLRRYKEAKDYVKESAETIKAILRKQQGYKSNSSKLSLLNLYGLIFGGLA